MSDDFKTGVATATRWIFIGTPDNYETRMVRAGDPIPPGAKSRPWFLGQEIAPVEPPEKPKAKKTPARKKATTKKK